MNERNKFGMELNQEKKLLVVILCGINPSNSLSFLDTSSLTLQHVIYNAKQFRATNVSVVIADEMGALHDLNTVKNDEIIIATSVKQLENLKSLSSPLTESVKFDKCLMVGNAFTIFEELTFTLKELLKKQMQPNGLIRFQICNFKDKQDTAGHDFVSQITPSSCRVSIPDNWSIISSKDTRAIDLNMDSNVFEVSKGPLRNLLVNGKKDKAIEKELIQFITTTFNSPDVVQNIKIIHANGSSEEIKLAPQQQHHI